MEEQLLHGIAETLLAIFNDVPALFVAESSPQFPLIRAMLGLILVLLMRYVLVLAQPVFSTVARRLGQAYNLLTQKR